MAFTWKGNYPHLKHYCVRNVTVLPTKKKKSQMLLLRGCNVSYCKSHFKSQSLTPFTHLALHSHSCPLPIPHISFRQKDASYHWLPGHKDEQQVLKGHLLSSRPAVGTGFRDELKRARGLIRAETKKKEPRFILLEKGHLGLPNPARKRKR